MASTTFEKPMGTEVETLKSDKQSKSDNTLQTTAKTVVGAVNEINSKIESSVIGTSPNGITSNSNLNDYTTPGLYACPSTATVTSLSNCPVNIPFSLTVRQGTSGSYPVQELVARDTGLTYTRSKASNGWTDWEQLALNSNIANRFANNFICETNGLSNESTPNQYNAGLSFTATGATTDFPYNYGIVVTFKLVGNLNRIMQICVRYDGLAKIRSADGNSWGDWKSISS